MFDVGGWLSHVPTCTGPLDRLDGGSDELSAISPEFRTTGEKQEVLVEEKAGTTTRDTTRSSH